MFIELTEALACPACDSTSGLVGFVDRMEGRRVMEGDLGCAFCEMRRPIREGVVFLDEPVEAPPEGDEPPEEPQARGSGRARAEPDLPAAGQEASGQDPDTERRAVEAAALLGLHERPGGYVLLDEALAAAAPRVAAMGRGVELISLASRAVGGELADSVNVVVGAEPDGLPVLDGALRGVVLSGGSSARVEAAERALGFEGRLVVLRPRAETLTAVEKSGLRVMAAEERALVAVRG